MRSRHQVAVCARACVCLLLHTMLTHLLSVLLPRDATVVFFLT